VCNDADGDGYNDDATGGTDCNDANAAVHPGATEICGDGKDNDCVGGDATCPATGTGGATGVVQTTCTSATNGKVTVGYIETCTCASGTTGQTQCQANGTWNTCYNCAAVPAGTGGAANNGTGGTTATTTGTKNVTIKFLSPKPFTDLGYIQFSGVWGNNIVTSATAWTLFCD